METAIRAVLSAVPLPLFVFIVGIVGAIVSWFWNEHSKRIYEDYKRKEEKYSELIKCLRGFHVESPSKELKEKFLIQLDLCWLYCPDEVIHKVYNFISMVHVDVGKLYPDEAKAKAVGECILAMRKDLINRKLLKSTSLKPEDFKLLCAK